MAVMGRKKQAIGKTWAFKNSQKEVKIKEVEEKPISEEDHKERLKKLKELGLIK